MHASFECLLNGGFIATNDDELKLLGAKVFRTEWTVYATEEDLAGSIDLAMQLPDQSLILVDWKRTQQLMGSAVAWPDALQRFQIPLCDSTACS